MDGAEIVRRCAMLAQLTEEPGHITRTYLSQPMHEVHGLLRGWMRAAGMEVRVDAAGNLRGVYRDGPRLLIGSHADTAPDAGAFDGVLGILIGIALVERRPPCAIEVAAFSGTGGARGGIPFFGSRALVGSPSTDAPVLAAIRAFGLDPERLPDAVLDPAVQGYLEFHIEQGSALECLELPLGVVEAISGLSRWDLHFQGNNGFAATTPMDLRRDALACAAEWIGLVEHVALSTPGLMATVDTLAVRPGASNAIPSAVEAGLSIGHALDEVRDRARELVLDGAIQIAERRGLKVEGESKWEQPSAALDCELVEDAVNAAGYPVHRLAIGALHDAAILARKVPASMLLLRNRDEAALVEAVDAALAVGARLLSDWDPE